MNKLLLSIARIKALFVPEAIERDMDKEMRFHFDMLVKEYEASGMSSRAAKEAALRRFGNLTQLKERGRDVRGAGILEELRQDLQYGARMLRRNAGFTVVALLALALGIGVNTAIFSIADGLFFRSAFRNVDGTILRLYGSRDNGGVDVFSYANYKDIRDQNKSFAELAAHQYIEVSVGAGEALEDVQGEIVTGNYFSVFNVKPRFGRLFLPEDDTTSGPIVVLSESFWRRQLSSDPNPSGKRVQVNGHVFDIVGVVPDSFRGTFGAFTTDMWFPLSSMQLVRPRETNLSQRGWGWLRGTGRLKPGISITQASAEIDRIAEQLRRDYPRQAGDINFQLLEAGNLRDELRADASRILLFFTCAAGAVLLITCANIASMMLSKTTARRREVAIRQSLGAGRFRLIRQWITESVLLAAIGGGLGLVLAIWVKQVLLSFVPPEWSNFSPDVTMDWRVLLFAAGLAIMTGVLFGVAPALHAGRASMFSALKSDAASTMGRRSRFYGALVTVQVTLSLVLLIASGLLFRSLRESQTMNLGFDGDRLVVAHFDLVRNGYKRPEQRAFYEQLFVQLKSAPGVSGVTHGMFAPLSNERESMGYRIEANDPPAGSKSFVVANDIVGPDYFSTMGVPIVEGRGFDPSLNAGSPREAVVNETFARKFWPNQSALGKMIGTGSTLDTRVVGVARTIAYYTLGETSQPFVYLSAQQSVPPAVSVFIRSAADAESIVAVVKQAVHAVNSAVSTNDILTFTTLRQGPLFQTRALMTTAGIFGSLALILTLIGVYGVISYSVSRRTHEFGIRIALGARRSGVFRMVIGEGLRLTVLGVVLGMLAAFGSARLLGGLLFGVTASDPATFISISLFVLITSALACFVPARRATRVDPIVALRQDA